MIFRRDLNVMNSRGEEGDNIGLNERSETCWQMRRKEGE